MVSEFEAGGFANGLKCALGDSGLFQFLNCSGVDGLDLCGNVFGDEVFALSVDFAQRGAVSVLRDPISSKGAPLRLSAPSSLRPRSYSRAWVRPYILTEVQTPSVGTASSTAESAHRARARGYFKDEVRCTDCPLRAVAEGRRFPFARNVYEVTSAQACESRWRPPAHSRSLEACARSSRLALLSSMTTQGFFF